MKKKLVMVITIFILNLSAILLILTILIDPVQLKQSVFTYSQGEPIPETTADYVNGSFHTLDKAILDIENVDSTMVGIYDCKVTYRKKTYPFQIQIKDSAAPIAELIKVKWEIKVGETLVAAQMITNVQENSAYQVYFDGKEPVLERLFDVPGTYNDIYIFVEDQFGNQSERLRVSVSVGSDQIAPVLEGVDDLAIYLGSHFDPLKGVSALDNLDGDITKQIIVIGEVNVKKEGTYRLVYTIKDQAGNVTKVIRTITVTTKPFNPTLVPDIGNGLYITKAHSNTRYNYFTTIRKSKLYMNEHSEIIDALVNYLVDNAVYINKDQDEYATSYSVIVDKVGNNRGFASAVKYMCDQLEIPCYYVVGEEGSVAEAWNIILYKGNFYHINVTSLYKKSDKIFYSDIEMEQKGYLFDHSKYPKCQETYKESEEEK